jgi:hypothetical protein
MHSNCRNPLFLIVKELYRLESIKYDAGEEIVSFKKSFIPKDVLSSLNMQIVFETTFLLHEYLETGQVFNNMSLPVWVILAHNGRGLYSRGNVNTVVNPRPKE